MAREMKDSGIEWIGEIPNNWRIDRIKYHLKRNEPRNPGNKIVLSVYREYGVIPKDSRNDNHNVTSEDISKYKYVRKGNLVVNKMKAWQGSLAVSQYEGIASPAYFIYEFTDKNLNKRYFHHLIRGCYKDEFRRLSGGIREGQWDLSPDEFSKTLILLPPFEEQQKIADYIDKKCAEIDLLSVDIESQISILEDYKKSVITEVVTKGLNPDVKMKSSGIEWIGKIPMNWEVSKIKYELECKDELREPISAEKRDRKNPQYDYYGASGAIDKIDYYNVDDEVLLIGEDGANLVMRNLPLIYKAKGKFWVNNHAHILKPFQHNDYNYLGYLLEAGDYTNYITGSAQPKLSQSNLISFYILKVPVKEQKNIADYLDKKCVEIDDIIAEKKKQLEVLEQYKKSLIYEYVTGKREIPDNNG